MSDLNAKLEAMEKRISTIEGREEMLDADTELEIRHIAKALAAGDKGPLRAWNRRKRDEELRKKAQEESRARKTA